MPPVLKSISKFQTLTPILHYLSYAYGDHNIFGWLVHTEPKENWLNWYRYTMLFVIASTTLGVQNSPILGEDEHAWNKKCSSRLRATSAAALTLTSILPSTTPTYQFLPPPQLGFFLISSLKQLKKLLYILLNMTMNVLGTAVKCVLPKTNNFGAYHLETSKNRFKLANTPPTRAQHNVVTFDYFYDINICMHSWQKQ